MECSSGSPAGAPDSIAPRALSLAFTKEARMAATVFQPLTPALARNVSTETNTGGNSNTNSGGGKRRRKRGRRGGRRNTRT